MESYRCILDIQTEASSCQLAMLSFHSEERFELECQLGNNESGAGY